MKNRVYGILSRLALVASIGLFALNCFGFAQSSLYGGLGYFSENTMGKMTTSPTGEGSKLGTTSFPLLLRYDWEFMSGWFLSPTLTYTLLTRSDPSDSAKVTIWQLLLPVGGNIASIEGLDWFAGPGLINREIKGSGGTTVLSNGGGTATFALPGRSVTTRNIVLDLGSSYSMQSSRFALDLVIEGLMSSKRNYNLMLSYSYAFMGGHR